MSFRTLLRPLKTKLRYLQAAGIRKTLPNIVRTIPHDSAAFTQGLFIHEHSIYESTGLTGQSSIREVDKHTGSLKRSIPVEKVFAEGIAILNGLIYQLTWKSGEVLVYSFPELEMKFTLPRAGQGWGLSTDGTNLIVSDGSPVIDFRDPSLSLVKTLGIRMNGIPLGLINDLAYLEGELFFNVYRHARIYVADISTGHVNRIIDMSEIAQHEYDAVPDTTFKKNHAMLNGIAIDEEEKLVCVTGKLWSNYYLISID